ncbi:hypothetical protein [Aliikangiella sp. IMCC44359]|uniref:hypothetical protein n=1 Tax=Aliikangiella sp. IMCC44359 TaxID=3459125 RepID=UPI00403AF8AD
MLCYTPYIKIISRALFVSFLSIISTLASGVDEQGCPGPNCQNNVEPPAPPTNVALPASTSTSGNYQLTWEHEGYPMGYQVKQSKNGGAYTFIQESLNPNKYLDIAVAEDGQYVYQVFACNPSPFGVVCSGGINSGGITVALKPATPSAPSAPNKSYTGSIAINWSAVTHATYYNIQQKLNNGSWATIDTNQTSLNKTYNSLADGTYAFRVQACNEHAWSCSDYGSSSNTAVINKPGMPASLTVPTSSSDSVINISWGASTGIVSQYLLRRLLNDASSYTQVALTSAKSINVTHDSSGIYKYQVLACNEGGCGEPRLPGNNLEVRLKPAPPFVPTLQYNADGLVSVSWPAAQRATYYNIQKRLNGGSWTSAVNSVAQLNTIFSVSTDGVYDVRVQACNTHNWSCSNFGNHTSLHMTLSGGALSQSTNQVEGDFNGDGNLDVFNQALIKGELSSISPLEGFNVNNFHINWTTAHPDISAIEDWSAEEYSAYSGNFNDNPGDELLLLGAKEIVLIHSEIIIPITIFTKVRNAIVSWDSSNNASFVEFPFDADPKQFKVTIGDLDEDGYDEIILQGKTRGATSYVLTHEGNLKQTLNNGYLGVDWSAATYDIEITEDGIILTNTTTNEVSIAYISPTGIIIRVPKVSRYIHTDLLGSPVSESDSAGNIIE